MNIENFFTAQLKSQFIGYVRCRLKILFYWICVYMYVSVIGRLLEHLLDIHVSWKMRINLREKKTCS